MPDQDNTRNALRAVPSIRPVPPADLLPVPSESRTTDYSFVNMSTIRRKYKPKDFESTGKSNDTSANIYESMLESPAFKDMTKNQRLLYVYMKAQYYGKRKPSKDYPDEIELQDQKMFYFNRAIAIKYGIIKENSNNKEFYRDIHEIEKHGFIKTVANGKSTKTKSIYQFSDLWQVWKNN